MQGDCTFQWASEVAVPARNRVRQSGLARRYFLGRSAAQSIRRISHRINVVIPQYHLEFSFWPQRGQGLETGSLERIKKRFVGVPVIEQVNDAVSVEGDARKGRALLFRDSAVWCKEEDSRRDSRYKEQPDSNRQGHNEIAPVRLLLRRL